MFDNFGTFNLSTLGKSRQNIHADYTIPVHFLKLKIKTPRKHNKLEIE